MRTFNLASRSSGDLIFCGFKFRIIVLRADTPEFRYRPIPENGVKLETPIHCISC